MSLSLFVHKTSLKSNHQWFIERTKFLLRQIYGRANSPSHRENLSAELLLPNMDEFLTSRVLLQALFCHGKDLNNISITDIFNFWEKD